MFSDCKYLRDSDSLNKARAALIEKREISLSGESVYTYQYDSANYLTEFICENCVVGAGAVVVKDIEHSGTYVGVPAKELL